MHRRLEALAWMDRWVDPALLFLAATSIPMLIVQTGDPSDADRALVTASAWVIWGAFTVNFAVRLALAPDRRAELRHLAWDLLLIVGQPVWAIGDRTAGAGIAFVRLVVAGARTVQRGRLLRRTGQKLRTQPMRILAFVVPMVWLTSAALLYRFEVDDGTVANLWDALWWSAVTMATVGYGDIFPVSVEGRVVAIITMIVGIGMFSVITAKLAEVLFVQRSTANRRALEVTDHTLVVGWSPKVLTIVAELVEANASRETALIVVLGEEDSFVMADVIEAQVPQLRHATTRLITRTGDPRSLTDLARCHPGAARSIIVATPDEEGDSAVVRAVLALQAVTPTATTPVVAQIDAPATAAAIRRSLGDRFVVVDPTAFLARAAAQACQSSGIADAYDQLLSFTGSEIYVLAVPQLLGRPFGDAVWAFPDACLIGVRRPDGTVELNPPPDRTIGGADELVLVAVDDDAITVDPEARAPATDVPPPVVAADRARHVLVLGWSRIGPIVVDELAGYLPDGSTITVALDPDLTPQDLPLPSGGERVGVEVRAASGDAYADLIDELADGEVDQAMVLAYRRAIGPADADAKSLVTTLHLRSRLAAAGRQASILTELLDERDAVLAEAASAGDFILSERLVSLVLAQLSETPALAGVMAELLDPAGSELYAKPADWYTTPGTPTTVAHLGAAAMGRRELLIGYRHDGRTVVNPPKASAVTLGAGDHVLVLAADSGSANTDR